MEQMTMIYLLIVVAFMNLIISSLLIFKKPLVKIVEKKAPEPKVKRKELSEGQIESIRKLKNLGASARLIGEAVGITDYYVYKYLNN